MSEATSPRASAPPGAAEAPGPDAFDLLGLPPRFALDLAAAEQRHRDLSRALHPDRHAGEAPATRRAALGRAIEVNQAWRVLRDPVRRAEVLCRRLGVPVGEGREPPASPALLMDVLEQREALSEAHARRDAVAIRRLEAEVRERAAGVSARLGVALDTALAAATTGGPGLAPERTATIQAELGELRYLGRFLEEAGALADDL